MGLILSAMTKGLIVWDCLYKDYVYYLLLSDLVYKADLWYVIHYSNFYVDIVTPDISMLC